MKRSVHSHRICAFTLIELLTVIAIIGILAAIIIPVTAKVRNKARGMQCLSNLRQLQTANILYAEEHRGAYVIIRDDDYAISNTGSGKWWYSNYDFLAILSPRSQMIEQLKCPLGKATYSTVGTNEKSTAYGANITGVPDTGGGKTFYQVNASQILNPSRKLAFLDGLNVTLTYTHSNEYNGVEVGGTDTPAYRHDGGANVVFYDGHAAFMKRDKVAKDAADLNKPQWDLSR
ncbi:prepilin-type N-terminal cleavage/methylation domain-containing protein [Geminisphaera colitermitum]|uniref:prepilin-type N-terminal cleavage/methylation domain-containing protein n=1 Tax=Geminisphaera colitermitum TaxID=1148786 RepID=UPI000158D347|nr:H-X9-DG-CTERM domain-containing protein [Geminisphaera colitermitum]